MAKFKSLEDYEKGTLPYRQEYISWRERIKKRLKREIK